MATLFISYSHKDEALRDELEVHLAMLKREGTIDVWHDRRITAGDEFDSEINASLETADVILLLVSPDFLASRYCFDVEVRRAMQRHEQGSARIIPIILRPSDWKNGPFAKLQAAPKDAKAVTKWPDRDEAFLDVVQQIRIAVGTRRRQPTQPSTLPPPVKTTPRSSNLRLKKEFTEADKDRFLDEAFEFVARFFEGSLDELSARNPGIETRFKRLDASAFSAVVYRSGKAVAQCGIRNGSATGFGSGLTYSQDKSAPQNAFNESLSVEATDQALVLTPMAFGFHHGARDKHLTKEGAAEYFWAMLIEPLQR